MKILLVSFIIILFSFSSFGQLKRTLFNTNWEFQMNAADPVTVVNLPHSPKLEPLVMKGQFLGKVVYRKSFDYPLEKGKHLSIHFEGAMHTADIFLNGQLVGFHVGGYLPFDVDLTGELRDSANVLEVYLDNREDPTVPPGKPIKDLDFYYHAGIYRNVWLVEASGVQIQDPYFQTISANAQLAEIKLDFDLKFDLDWIILPLQVEAKLGETVIQLSNEQFIDSSNTIVYKGSLKLNTPKLWSPTEPKRYDLTIQVIYAGDTLAKQQLKVGIRKPELRTDGFYLNGEKLFLSGTNRHQEYPYVGYAVPDNAQKRDAQLIKDAGFNFVRLSHYPQAPAFYEACDELGIIVMDAIAGWQYYNSSRIFEQRCRNDLYALTSRDRNHPSVIFWENSLNETNMPDDFIEKMNFIFKEQIGGNGFSAGWIDNPSYDVFIPARQHAQAPNYWAGYKPKAKAMLIAEYGDWEYYAQNAGFNQTQFADLTPSQRNSRHLRGATEQALLQQAYNFQEASTSNRKGANIIGEANWVCFDYNRGYSPDLEASGIYDITRLPKYAVGFYKSQLLDVTQKPFVQIANNWTALSPTTVTIFSNCPQVALYLNDSLIGKKQAQKNAASAALANPTFLFEIKQFNPGKLTAIGLDNKQKTLQTSSIQTPQKPIKIKLELATLETGVDTAKADLIFVRAKLLDANGTVVPTNDYKVTFSVQAQDAGLMCPAIQQVESGIASALLRTEAPQTPVEIKVSCTALGLYSRLTLTP
ncbi:MAG: glycoside hydrolase family 2 TIM barrel-domain containing protein [Flavobacteriales bacterium]